MRVKRVVFIALIIGVLSSAAQAVLPLGGNVARNVSDIGDAVGANPGHVQHALLNPSCSNPQFERYDAATYSIHPLKLLNEQQSRRFGNVGMIGRASDKGDLFRDTASVTGCPCVVTTSAHNFWGENKLRYPIEGQFVQLGTDPYRKESRLQIVEIEAVGTTNPTNDLTSDKDWAVVTVVPKPDIVPFKIPPENFDLSALKQNKLVSVGYHKDLASQGDLGRRISECDFNVNWDPYWSNEPIHIAKEDLNLNSCSVSYGVSGAAIVPESGKYSGTMVSMIEAQMVEGNFPRPSEKNYNIAVPVRGKFREAIINACNKCTGSEDWQKHYIAK